MGEGQCPKTAGYTHDDPQRGEDTENAPTVEVDETMNPQSEENVATQSSPQRINVDADDFDERPREVRQEQVSVRKVVMEYMYEKIIKR